MDEQIRGMVDTFGMDDTKDTLKSFLDSSEILLDLLHQSVGCVDKDATKKVSHELKGICLSIGADELADLLLEVETIAYDNSVFEIANHHSLYSILSEIEDGMELTHAQINEFLSN
jgi:hypothetical protein